MLTFAMELLAAGIAGLLSHWLWFVHGEHDNNGGRYVRMYAMLEVLILILQYQFLANSPFNSVVRTVAVSSVYFTALYTSIILYRLLLSPIRHIPGPIPLKISKIYHAWSIRRLDNYHFLEGLQQKYGDVVRTGPNEVTCFTAEAFEKVYGQGSECTKAVYYDAPKPINSLVNQRNPEIHQQWRKVWDQAFSWKALDSYEPTIYQQAEKLIKWLEPMTGKPVEIGNEFERYTFDILGLLGLGHEFKLLEGMSSRAYDLYHSGRKIFGPIVSMPWFVSATSVFPRLHKGFYEQNRWIRSELEKRKWLKPERKAVIDHVIQDAHANGGWEANYLRLQGDFMITMAAGTDPMHKCLTDMMWFLAADRSRVEKIRAEFASMSSITDYKTLMTLPYFNAIIYETMRLHPPIPAAGVRNVPPEGMYVSEIFIPGHTVVLVPQHVLFRREDCFARSKEFIPERWTSQPELILDKNAYQPWSSGRFACIGKNLGLMEIRVAAALFIDHFDFEFAPGYDRDEVFDKMTDHFAASPGPLHLVLQKREKAV